MSNEEKKIKELEKENKLLTKMNREYKKEIDKLTRENNNLKKHQTLSDEELHSIYKDAINNENAWTI